MIKPRLIFDKIKAYFDSPEAIIITGTVNQLYSQNARPAQSTLIGNAANSKN